MCAALATPAPLWAQEEPAPAETSAGPVGEPAAATPAPDSSEPPASAPAPAPAPAAPAAPAAPEPDPAQVPSAGPPVTEVVPAAPVTARQGGVTVSMIDYAYEPSSIEIALGGSVTFVNDGPDEPHTATADDGSFDTGEVAVGGSSTVAFDRAGTFSYLCTLHPNMKGSVTVLASDDGGPDPTTGDENPAGSGDPSIPGPTEAAAVASPDAAGTATSLPATGEETGLLAAAGLALLACGLQLAAAQRLGRRWADR
jgi:plastocyanin